MKASELVVATGRTGSIGHYLSDHILGLSMRLDASESDMVRELRSLPDRPQAMIHLAAMTSVKDCEANPEKAFALNAEGARKWLRACDQVGIPRFIQVSTSHIFKPTSSPEVWTTDRTADAVSAYGRSKAEAERVLLQESKNLKIQLVIARVFSVIAEDMRPGFLFPELHRRAREKDFKPLPGYKNVRDFMHARDVGKSLELLATTKGLDRTIFHVCTGKPKSVRELAVEVCAAYGIQEPETLGMFPATDEQPNYMISEPTRIES